MADQKAEQIIAMRNIEAANALNFKNLYQDVADHMLPRQDQITRETTPGEDKSQKIFDPTAMLDLQDMVSGLSATFFPAGQQAFGLTVNNRLLVNVERVKRYLALAAQITHDELFQSNFMLQLNETLTQLIAFGTGCLYSEWDSKRKRLNFKSWDIARYTIRENNQGVVDGITLTYFLTAHQATEEFGDKAGEKILEAAKDIKKQNRTFEFIHFVQERNPRNINLVSKLNKPFESLYVNVEEKLVVHEGGYDEFPYAVPRWMKSSGEIYGRGQGTMVLSAVKESDQMHTDFIECGNKWNNPPLEVVESFEGRVRVTPGAQNRVLQINSIRAIEGQTLGSFPISKQMLTFQQEIIHRAFFVDVFAPLANLPGDRRTTVEIYQRVKQAMKKLSLPVYRIQTEGFVPEITRSVLLLIRWGRIPEPPPELRGQNFGIEFLSELALAMRDQQARGFQQFAALVSTLEATFPEARDLINIDRALPDIAISFGMKVEHLSTEEEIAAKRQARALEEASQKLAMAAQVAAEAYGKTSKSPAEASPAAELIGAMKGE